MKEQSINTITGSFKTQKTHTLEEKLAAGGASAFGNKSGKSMQNLIKKSQDAPSPEPFTKEEWEQSLLQLNET
jgi:hypothetical protein